MSAALKSATSLLRGDDGRISFSKCVLVTLLVGWLFRVPLSAELALVFIVASHGTKILLRYLDKRGGQEADDAE